ncbi:glutamine amidotransferase subunit PdxT [Clostridium pasteurianum DSM 525 = ATCC 6013]|uniref:Pyridoxal 5'-phosphate synthase subunit PdxT n=1 Tax=Clostridium pasteurianum DSM 525 = ATCC 6013 TaxID=1262449 RepID=A0A0H3J4G9_CLOPA|nr:pyridoxal 5'-phosphate synthase glutaminase subunit PdxT [Clostridium pasteurianum]AJA47807.1 glutamine amidotransferase subunit PdxT [Clostridium pasteurianum DSM 525 = ATCC 6013]AJA51795.1 glutamine amidotransferase subunit PdxT [Clostridium pasteurianum DSM 525 = ATCC 6013]AOZ75099.1 glutamine amidotransferase [Clostridium pasteurianum DSM 525 = ATCC 6013]AOZ78894.1 glutamine amidotransferase [Clostridium pasteurianum]ELP59708.1 glutamine amidotransferase subunit PdxT [Clostridium pasteu
MKIGILSLQGGVIEHIEHINSLNQETVEVKKQEDLEDVDGIILPGGESTTIGKLLSRTGLLEPLREKILKGLPVWGTCAGMILLAKNVENWEDSYLKLMNINVRRNAYGRQRDSFQTEELIEKVSSNKIPLVFIRAPFITKLGEGVEKIYELDGNVVAARENNMLVTSFHPELTDNLDFHRYFLTMCRE